MDAIELRMGDLRRYIITMIDEHSDYALALAVLHSTAILPAISSARPQSSFLSLSDKLSLTTVREFLGNFDKTLQEASIKHIWTYPYTPKMNTTAGDLTGHLENNLLNSMNCCFLRPEFV